MITIDQIFAGLAARALLPADDARYVPPVPPAREADIRAACASRRTVMDAAAPRYAITVDVSTIPPTITRRLQTRDERAWSTDSEVAALAKKLIREGFTADAAARKADLLARLGMTESDAALLRS